jgi:hypothetical protein
MYFTFKLKEQLESSSPSVYNKGGAGGMGATNAMTVQPPMQPTMQNTAGCQPTFMQQQQQATQQAALSNMENQAITNHVTQPAPSLGLVVSNEEIMEGMRKISRGGKG